MVGGQIELSVVNSSVADGTKRDKVAAIVATAGRPEADVVDFEVLMAATQLAREVIPLQDVKERVLAWLAAQCRRWPPSPAERIGIERPVWIRFRKRNTT